MGWDQNAATQRGWISTIAQMRRRLLNALTALLLLLCVAVVALWVRSDRVTDGVAWGRATRTGTLDTISIWAAGSGGGRVALVRVSSLPLREAPDRVGLSYRREPSRPLDRPRPAPTLWSRLGFFMLEPPEQGVILPHWCLVLTTGALPAWRAIARGRAGKRAARGLCSACGYDLRATPGRCPECGTNVPEATGRVQSRPSQP
jgi:hypothetical protein